MKRGAVDVRVLVAWLTLGAGCTDPSFRTLDDASMSSMGDAGGMQDGAMPADTDPGTDGPPTIVDDSRADAGVSFEPDGGAAAEAGGAAEAGAAAEAGQSGGSDAATDAGGASSDAGPPGATLPAWAKPLIGRYLKQSISVGYDSNVGMPIVSSERSLVSVVEESNGQLSMQVQTCGFNSQWYDQSIRFALVKPSSLPIAKLRVILGAAPHFSTETVDRAYGFDPARQASCGGMGQRIDKFKDQVWLLTSYCTCATYPELPPQSSSDCRLTDPDGDRQPGVLISSTTGVFNFSVAMSTSLKIVEGVVAQDREHTLREQGRANVSCVNTGEDGCTLGAPVACGDVVTDVRPLADDASCATVLAYNLPVGTLPVDQCPK